MSALSESRIVELLSPYLGHSPVPDNLYPQLGVYLELLLRWNARTNLTAIREPEEIVQRHFGESLFVGGHLCEVVAANGSMLDFGSGAGFPGLPIQLLLPELRCCLAESQGKKAAFLREAVRTLGLTTEVWSGRVEAMPAERRFDCVTLRAVDQMGLAVTAACARIAGGGVLAKLGSNPISGDTLPQSCATAKFAIPGGHSRMLYLYRCG